MPGIEKDLWKAYGSKGFTAVAVHVDEDAGHALPVVKEVGLTFPVYLDIDSQFLGDWSRIGEGVPVYPLSCLVAKDGTIAAVYSQTEPEMATLKAKVESLLAK